MKTDSRIYVAGHRDLVGSAIVRRLQAEGHRNLVVRTHAELDLNRQDAVLDLSRIHALGWRAKAALADGVRQTYDWFAVHAADRAA